MTDQLSERIRLLVGLGVPVVGTSTLGLWAVIGAIRHGDWVAVGISLPALAILFGPFVFYYLAIRTSTISTLTAMSLVGVAIFTVVATKMSFDRGSSTAPLALLWLPFLGYPLVAVAAFLEALARPSPSKELPRAAPPRPRRWSVSIRGNWIEISRRRTPSK